MKFVNVIVLLITIIGAFNWFLLSVFSFNLVNSILADYPVTEKIVYVIIGLCALYSLKLLKLVYRSK
ncbi:DUF378 domain-containing protein [Fangia hongkongensis]|uniref:DUF378 domain-containing protein n=1 Tax=Fangia hongkongensis TaxID=270495 RepID=UPI00035CA494|nr:DUF378 domain-containing protein [Fangia hongkongensis]MBK2125766.1 DUF378 domain-containing protein [Fangia hongkongensis]